MPYTQRQQVCSRGHRSSHLLPLVLALLSLTIHPSRAAIKIPSNYHIDYNKTPPEITGHPESVTVFSGDELAMSCEASGSPPPRFRWKKDGEDFDPSGDPELKVAESKHEFKFSTLSKTLDTLNQYRGKYVCYASNELGTAVSSEAIVRTDVPPSQQKDTKTTVTPEEGSSVVLNCNPPVSAMEPAIHWMDLNLRHLQLSERVVVGKDGNLYFAHVMMNDSRDDYTCNVQYLATRTILAKAPIAMKVKPLAQQNRSRRPQMLRPEGKHSTYHALRGQTVDLECIVKGLPTPNIAWNKKEGGLSDSRAIKEMFDRQLRLLDVTEEDSGEYECIAENTQGRVKHTYDLTVEAAPYWKKKPESQIYAPGETVKLDCEAKGTPTPTITWNMNGKPLSAAPINPRHTVTANASLILENVNFEDTAVYQCIASNHHGSIHTNTHVYVIELPPQILTEKWKVYPVTEGKNALLECETFGSPKPEVIWERDASQLLSNPRVNPLTNGGLEIFNVTHDDNGFYTCSVKNNNLSIIAEINVFNQTIIVSPPTDLKVQSGSEATFTCLPVYDDNLRSPQIQWRKNGQKLFESSSDDKYKFEGAAFTIANVEPADEGIYTCEVITSLDNVEASATLTLCDRPDPPDTLQISDPKHREVTLSWTPGDDHKSAVLEYVIEFENQDLRSRGWEELTRVGGNREQATLSLWPNIPYRFRVIAINDIGKSDPSEPSETHKTLPEAPDNNPENVRSESIKPNLLVITWEKMDPHNFNGPDFKYKVQWRQAVGSGSEWHSDETESPPFTVSNIRDFSAYEFKVRAINAIGEGPDPDPVIGYPGEDDPLEAPMDVGVEVLNSTAIKVQWAAIDQHSVRGHLMGYKVHLTRKGFKSHHKGHSSKESEHTVEETGPNEKKKVISNLRPYSHYEVAVTVFNKKGEGPQSEPLKFETKEGVPSPPTSLILDSPSETQMTLHWTPPAHPNGILTGYLLQYQQITQSDDSPMQEERINNPTITSQTVKGLDRHSRYRFYLRGHTSSGDGEPIMMTGATTQDGEPPSEIRVSTGENLVNVSWEINKIHRNVGFYIQYKIKNGGSKEKSERVNSSQSFYQLQGLTPGSEYQLNFIHGNKTFWNTDIKTEGRDVPPALPSIANQGWFISVVSAVALLLLILLILCFIKRSKGGKYSVKDKEDGPLDSEARPMKDETFGEYRSLESDLEEKRTASQPSLCEDNKMCSEDTLNFNGSSALTTELNLDESLASQISRPSDGTDGFHVLAENSPLHPTTIVPATNGMSNTVKILN